MIDTEEYDDGYGDKDENRKAYVVNVIYKNIPIKKKQILHIATECYSVFYCSDRKSINIRFYEPENAAAFAAIINSY
jgi:hypothetical protein